MIDTFPVKNFQKIGWEAQKKLAPSYRETPLDLEEIKKQNPREAATLCLWYQKEEEWFFPLIQRESYEGVHSNQISFPGGAKEEVDKNFWQTAVRETEEELGIELGNTFESFELSELYIPPSNFLVYPFMAISDTSFIFYKDDVEVKSIIEISSQELQNAKIKYTEKSKGKVPYFELKGHMVWGATAMILNEIKEILFLSL